MKTLLLFAHWEEARHVIRHFDAHSTESPTFYKRFSCASCDILVTGMGVFNMQAAVVHYFSDKADIDCVINVGLAGSAAKSLHTWYVVSSVHCNPFKPFYTDPVFSKLPYAPLHTVHRPANDTEMKNQPDSLFDMEGYGFISGARRFLQNHQIHLLKFVSDHDGKPESVKNSLKAYNESVVNAIETTISEIQRTLQTAAHHHSYIDLENAVKDFSNRQRLSFTQTRQLLEHCMYLVNKDQKEKVDSVLAENYLVIPDRDRRFKEICTRLGTDE